MLGANVGAYNCGEMTASEPDLETHGICGEGKSQVIYGNNPIYCSIII